MRRRLVLGDVLALLVVWGGWALTQNGRRPGLATVCSAVAVVVTLAVMQLEGLYRSRVCALRSVEAVRVVVAAGTGSVAFLSCGALAGQGPLVGPLEAASAAVLAILLLRWHFSRWLLVRRSASKFLRTVIMVGTNEDAEALWTLLTDEPELGYRVGGIAGAPRAGAPWQDLPSCTQYALLGDTAARVGANGVIVVASALAPVDRRAAIQEALAAGLHVQVWPGLDGLSSRGTRMAPVSGVPLLYVEARAVANWQLIIKRGMDILLSTFLVILTAPLIAVVAAAIRLTDGTPVIHRSQRVGRHGTTIEVLKFRTMVKDASTMMVNVAELNERKGGPLFKASHDPRVTKLGRILRATSVDELPQLWNVLNGTMSLVGPRPALVDEVRHFDPELRRRHQMRPGITGLWQVEARDNPSFSAYRRLDLAYIDDWSLGLDVAIIASTVHQLITRAAKAVLTTRADRSPSSVTDPVDTMAEGVPGQLNREPA